MTDRELMQQALEAMLNFPDDISDEMFESIKALRKRLAQPEQPSVPWSAALDSVWGEPEQEPVIGKWSLREVYFDEDGEPISHRSPPQRTWAGSVDLEDSNAYLTPTQRKPLTDEEIETCRQQGYDHSGLSASFDFVKAARAIEAKLKEKNT